jgi:sulfotransferase family protein
MSAPHDSLSFESGEISRTASRPSEASAAHLDNERVYIAADGGRLPRFFVVGPPRTGTTWLYRELRKVASLPAPIKEVNFFDLRYEKGVEWYLSKFDPRDQRPRGECAPTYFASDIVRRRIFDLVPQAKVICTLREPVSRLYSLWTMKRSNGVYGWGFEEALDRDAELVETMRYTHHLNGWLQMFGQEQVMAAFWDDLRTSPQHHFDKISGFLGLEKATVDSTAAKPLKQMTRPWSRVVARTASTTAVWLKFHKMGGVVKAAKAIGLRPLAFGRTLQYQPLDPETESRVRARLAKEIDDLEKLVGRDLSAWRKPRQNGRTA